MDGRFDHEHKDPIPTPPPECKADSPISGDEAAEEAYAPSPKKGRRGANKRVVMVPTGDGDGSRSKTEVYPPPDSWSWRKYGQKPIKGSPYPRGYYRCSSSKGCPARKQVERSRLNPTTLLVTYSCNHNHPLPTTTKSHGHQVAAASSAAKSAATSSSSDTTSSPAEESVTFSCQLDIEELCPADNGCLELAGEFGWLCNVGPTILDGTTLVVPTWSSQGVDVEFLVPIREEDKLLFGDLGDLPDSSMVSSGIGRRRHAVPPPDNEGYDRNSKRE